MDAFEEEYKRFKGHEQTTETDGFRIRMALTDDYRIWLQGACRKELLSRLSATPKTWPEIMKGFPGPYLPGREAAIGKTMEWLAKHGALVVQKVKKSNIAGFHWEEALYSINPLHQLAAL